MLIDAQPTDRFVQAGELNVHYLAWVREGPPVVLIHSA